MPNPQLSAEQLILANRMLIQIRRRLDKVSDGNPNMRFALNRKIAKELIYDERGKPGHRRKLKIQKRLEQNGKCASCSQPLPERGAILDRIEAIGKYP